MKKCVYGLMLFAMAVVASPAHATYYCTGTVTSVSVTSGGVVSLSGAGGVSNGYVCQLGTTAPNGYVADGCKAAYATLLSARLTGQPVTLAFNDNLTCSTQPQYGWMNVVNLFL